MAAIDRTTIYKQNAYGEFAIGSIGADGVIHRLSGGQAEVVGRVDAERRILRRTAYDERELGVFTAEGEVHSHGLFEGGAIGWVDADGVVVQAGLIFGEEEVGRVIGPDLAAGAAALLLLFLPEDAEANKRAART